MPKKYVDAETRRNENRTAVFRVPEGIRLAAISTPEEEKEPMNNEKTVSTPLRWPLVVVAVVAATVLGYVMLIPGCKTISTPTVEDVGHIVEDCTRPVVHSIATHILDDVSSALIMSDFGGGIVSIVANLLKNVAVTEYERAKSDAWEAAKCAVAEIKKQTGVHLGYGGMDFDTMTRERLMHENASDWLMVH